jgi:multidrug efflux pump subunit AcrB
MRNRSRPRCRAGLAVIFIYLILASQFASFTQPFAIMASLPFSLIGVFLALLLTGTTLNSSR